MSNINLIQSEIEQLEGGAFQSLFDEYLYKKYKFKNIQTLGVQTGTNKPTKGIPDSYVRTNEGKYILINYGNVESQPATKIKADILSCFNTAKLSLPKDKIEKIICGHGSTNIHIEQFESIMETIEGVEIELIGIDTLSHDLALIYPHIAKDQLGIAIDTNQFFDIEDFVKAYDANGINAPIDCELLHRDDEINETCKSIKDNTVTILTGPSGIGKTRLALEACRKQNGDEIKVYCIKSNGNLLYEDIKYYIDTPGKYLLFFDDANMVASLDNVLNTILTYSDKYEIKALITVRDYAKDRVINSVCKYSEPNIIEIGSLKDDEIEDILKNDLGILNPHYLRKITEISNGNIRLAFLAGIRSIDGGYPAIRNAEDIFKNYYGRIIDDAKLTKNDILMLFFITVAGPVKGAENQLYNDLKRLYGSEIVENDTIENLYSLELIDWFKNEIVKISDQSFGNYIAYYVLFEKRWIGIENLIAIAFPRYRNKALYVLRTLVEIFNSDELVKYVEDSIISAWNHAPADQDMEYLKSFYRVDPDKALSMIKDHIDREDAVDFDLRGFDIVGKKNNHNISTKEIEILGGYKYSDNYEDAVDLLMLYFTKRPDLIMDFYFVITEQLLYDEYSWDNKYDHELRLIDTLWNAAEEGENYNNSILYLHIAEYALKTEVSYIENVRNSRSVRFVTMAIGFTEEIAAIRSGIWKSLGILRKNDAYREIVNRILTEIHFSRLDEDDFKDYLESDFDVIFENIIAKDNPDFFDALIIDRYKEAAEQIGVTTDERFLTATKNQNFRLYKMLTREHLDSRTIEEDDRIRKECISKEICSYKLDDYIELFKSCKYLEKTVNERDQWGLNTGLDCVFDILEEKNELYVDVITEYFNENAPLKLNGYRQINYLINQIGYESTLALVSSKEFDKKGYWLSLIWECLSDEKITEQVVNDYKRFVLKHINEDNPIVPSVQMLCRYGEKDQELKTKVIKTVIERPKLSAAFLGYAYNDYDVEFTLHVFRDNMEELSSIYMSAIENGNYFDYDGKLFIKVFEQRSEIWNKYVDWVKDNTHHNDNKHSIFELIWSSEKWQECIDYAFKILIDDNIDLLIKNPAQALFAKTTDDTILNRKKRWLLEKLHERSMDIANCRKLIDVVVTAMPEWKLEFFVEFLKDNKKIEDFKKLHFYPLSYSWSGSEVPLILDKISFLQSLKDRLKGIDYIDHRKYLDERRRSLEEYLQRVELREYLDDADYA